MIGVHPMGHCKYCGEGRRFDNSRGNDEWPHSTAAYAARTEHAEKS